MTFDELFKDHNLTKSERSNLIHHLAAYRYRRTVNVLEQSEPERMPSDKREQKPDDVAWPHNDNHKPDESN